MLFGWSLGWLIANGWSLDRHRLCGNPALLRIRLVVLFAALVVLLNGWSVVGWLVANGCLFVGLLVGCQWLVLRESHQLCGQWQSAIPR